MSPWDYCLEAGSAVTGGNWLSGCSQSIYLSGTDLVPRHEKESKSQKTYSREGGGVRGSSGNVGRGLVWFHLPHDSEALGWE